MAFELAKILGRQSMVTESLVYFTKALELSLKDTISGQTPEAIRQRSEILMHRSCAYEALGLKEMQARDIRLIASTDQGFKMRYLEEAVKFEKAGYTLKAQKIKTFLQKMT